MRDLEGLLEDFSTCVRPPSSVSIDLKLGSEPSTSFRLGWERPEDNAVLVEAAEEFKNGQPTGEPRPVKPPSRTTLGSPGKSPARRGRGGWEFPR